MTASCGMAKVCPREGVITISASNDEYIRSTVCSSPLKIDSSTIMAATGAATDSTLIEAMMLITECDLGDSR